MIGTENGAATPLGTSLIIDGTKERGHPQVSKRF